MKKFYAIALLFLSCTPSKNIIESPTPNMGIYVIVDMDEASYKDKSKKVYTDHVKNFGVGSFRQFLKDQGTTHISKIKDDLHNWQFVHPLDDFWHRFSKLNVEFQCHNKHHVLVCDVVVPKNQSHYMHFSIADAKHSAFKSLIKEAEGDYAMHFCNIQVPFAIYKEDETFWSKVKSYQDKSKKEVYKDIHFTHMHGAIVILKGMGEHTKVVDFRSTYGIVEEGSDAYKKFVDPNCVHYGLDIPAI